MEDQGVHLGRGRVDKRKRNNHVWKKIPKQDEEDRPKPTSTPRVATYFFSNSPVRCLFTKVVLPEIEIKEMLNSKKF